MPRVRPDIEDFDLLERPKRKLDRDPHAAFEAKVRDFVLRTGEDWLTPKWIAARLHGGAAYVGRVLAAMSSEGILSPLQEVPQDEDVRVKVHSATIGRQVETPFDICAYAHDGEWVIGYYDRSSRDPRKTSLFYAKPEQYHKRCARIRGRRFSRRITEKEKREKLASYKYEPAAWDGRAFYVLRNGHQYVNACLAAGVEPLTDLPWVCEKCGRTNDSQHDKCERYECKGAKPKLLKEKVVRVCALCGEPDVDGHSRRHAVRKTAKGARSRRKCLEKMVDAVHKM